MGAKNILALGLAQFVVFEYNNKWSWEGANFLLANAVARLRAHSYLCFLISPTGLIPLSGPFFDTRFEIQTWSNVLCGRREDVLWTWSSDATGKNAPVSALPDVPLAPGATQSWMSAGGEDGGLEVRFGSDSSQPHSHGPLRKAYDALSDTLHAPSVLFSARSVEEEAQAFLAANLLPELPECAWAIM